MGGSNRWGRLLHLIRGWTVPGGVWCVHTMPLVPMTLVNPFLPGLPSPVLPSCSLWDHFPDKLPKRESLSQALIWGVTPTKYLVLEVALKSRTFKWVLKTGAVIDRWLRSSCWWWQVVRPQTRPCYIASSLQDACRGLG